MNDTQRDNGHEVSLNADQLIITKTDTKGLITYANRVFMDVAEYPLPQLLGQPHNLIRHPDMPRGVFRLMWKTLQEGKEFFGIVKNYTASGNYYWVLANITPDYSANHQLQGYFSVRRRPSRQAIDTVVPLYRQMCLIEQQTGKAQAPDTSMEWLLNSLREKSQNYKKFVLDLSFST